MTNARARATARWRNSVLALATGVVAAIAANGFGLAGGVSPHPPAPQVQVAVLQQHNPAAVLPSQQRINLPQVKPLTPPLGNANTDTANAAAAAPVAANPS